MGCEVVAPASAVTFAWAVQPHAALGIACRGINAASSQTRIFDVVWNQYISNSLLNYGKIDRQKPSCAVSTLQRFSLRRKNDSKRIEDKKQQQRISVNDNALYGTAVALVLFIIRPHRTQCKQIIRLSICRCW